MISTRFCKLIVMVLVVFTLYVRGVEVNPPDLEERLAKIKKASEEEAQNQEHYEEEIQKGETNLLNMCDIPLNT